jgi:hypothetical protein
MMAFDHNDLRTIGNAFDTAWDRFLLSGMLTPDNTQDAREILAKRILFAANCGEHDEWRLARDALFHLWQRQFAGTPPLAVIGEPHDSGAAGRSRLQPAAP